MMTEIGNCLTMFNTFRIPAKANKIVEATSAEIIRDIWMQCRSKNEPVLILGDGSNILFFEDFCGTVILNRILGFNIRDSEHFWHISIGSGEPWHETIKKLIFQHHIYGLENLALIPGRVGAAPIQNIGAYGLEFKDVCEYVGVMDLYSGKMLQLNCDSCKFSYRSSILMNEFKGKYLIVNVGIKLPKVWIPRISFQALNHLDLISVTAEEIFHSVCDIRNTKLPNPEAIGNAGSFFKNPIVSRDFANSLKLNHPCMPIYPQNDKFSKLSAGWLIDKCGFKGYEKDGAGVYTNNALVLVNLGCKSGKPILIVAKEVRDKVGNEFGVWLEPEPRLLGSFGEVNGVELLS